MTKPKSFAHARERNARKTSRFGASDRVEFRVGARPVVTFLENLSMGGMLLRSATGLTPAAEIEFQLFLEGNLEPITMRGRVLTIASSGARPGASIAFSPAQDPGEKQLRAYIERNVVKALEKACDRPHPSVRDVSDLAAFYVEFSRHADAIELFKKAIAASPRDLALYESYARSILKAADEQGDAGLPAVLAMEGHLKAALQIGHSPFLETVLADIDELRKDGTAARSLDGRLAQHVAWAVETDRFVRQLDHDAALRKLKDEAEAAKARGALEQARLAQVRATLEEQKHQLDERERELAVPHGDWERKQSLLADQKKAWRAEVEAREGLLRSREDALSKESERLTEAQKIFTEVRKGQQAELAELHALLEQQSRQSNDSRRAQEKAAALMAEADRRTTSQASREKDLNEWQKRLDVNARAQIEAANIQKRELHDREVQLEAREREATEAERAVQREKDDCKKQREELEIERTRLSAAAAELEKNRQVLESDRAALLNQQELMNAMQDSIAEREQRWAKSMAELDRQSGEARGLREQLSLEREEIDAARATLAKDRAAYMAYCLEAEAKNAAAAQALAMETQELRSERESLDAEKKSQKPQRRRTRP